MLYVNRIMCETSSGQHYVPEIYFITMLGYHYDLYFTVGHLPDFPSEGYYDEYCCEHSCRCLLVNIGIISVEYLPGRE